MPPRSRHDDAYDRGGIEVVVVVEDNDEAIVANRTLFDPPKPGKEPDEKEESDLFDESVEMTDSFMEQLLSGLGLGCAGCSPYQTTAGASTIPGILRKPGVPSTMNSRTVSFSSLEILEFGLTLGNHPNSSSGPPIRLDWDAKTTERTVSLDEYEQERMPRRKRQQLRLSYRERQRILEGQKGFTAEEVNRAWAEALTVQKQRQETLKRGTFLSSVDELWESTQRKCKRIVESVGIA